MVMQLGESGPADSPPAPFRVGDWDVDPTSCRVTRGDREVPIEPLLMDVLVYLADHRDEVVSGDRLVDEVWTARIVADGAVYRAIAQLRRLLGDDARRPAYIETIPKRGYRLIADVVALPSPESVPAPAQEAPTAALTPPAGSRRVGRLTVATLTVALVGLGWLSLRPGSPVRQASPPASAPSIAVLPFDNLGSDQDLTYFSDGLTEEILNSLAQLDGLQVVARTSSFAFREKPRDVRRIGDTLGVNHILEGSVRRADDTVRITAQLINADTGYHLWSQTFDRREDEILAMQREVSDAVARALRIKMLPTARSTARAVVDLNGEAYELFLLGAHHQRLVTAQSLAKAQGYFQQVIELEPDYAPAYAALANNYALLVQYNEEPLEENGPKALSLINKALSLDPDSSAAHHARGLVHFYGQDYAAAASAFQYASVLSPQNSSHLGMLARALHVSGRSAQALPFIERAVAIDPISPFVLINHAAILLAVGRVDEAVVQSRKGIDIAPEYLNGYWQLGWTLTVANDPASAVEYYERGIGKGIQQPDIYADMAVAYLDLGRYDDALVAAQRSMRNVWQEGEVLVIAYHLMDRLGPGVALRDDTSENDGAAPRERLGHAFAAYLTGDCDEARRIYELHQPSRRDELVPISPSFHLALGMSHDLNLADCYLAQGEPERAAPLLAMVKGRLLDQQPASRLAGYDYLLANAAALEGDHEDALRYLDRAAGSGWLRYEALVREPRLAGLSEDSRFTDIAQRIQANAHRARE